MFNVITVKAPAYLSTHVEMVQQLANLVKSIGCLTFNILAYK